MKNFVLGLLASASFAGMAFSHDLDEAEFKQMVIDAIMEQPEVVFDAIRLVRERETQELFASAASTENALVLGDPDAPITIVEFFDYNCGYCKRAASVMRGALEENSDVKIILREFPILSEGSIFAARAALASREQGMYEEFHWALMDIPQATEATVMAVAEELGLDLDQLRADIQNPLIADHIGQCL